MKKDRLKLKSPENSSKSSKDSLPVEISQLSDTKTLITVGERRIILVKTAHVSRQSVQDVLEAIEQEEKLDHICLELDKDRYETLMNPGHWKDLDIMKILREKKGFLLLVSLLLSSFQKRLGKKLETPPGEEMKQAILLARTKKLPYSFIDRPIQTTFLRAWRTSPFWQKMGLLWALFSSIFSKEDLEESTIESMRQTSILQGMLDDLSENFPSLKKVLIDERDFFLAAHLFLSKENNILAVIGAGHGGGVTKHLSSFFEGTSSPEVDEILRIPSRGWGLSLLSWIFPLALVTFFLSGFFFFGEKVGLHLLKAWILINGLASAAGALLALAHPITILVAFVAAPLTSMNPTLGVGLFSGISQALLRKPRVKDLEALQDDSTSFKGWYQNRFLHILTVVLLSTIGSVIGTVFAVPHLSAFLFR